MTCVRCSRDIPEGALFCPWCGKRQTAATRPKARRAKGNGSIARLQGRSAPYKAVYKGAYIGCYKTKQDAERAILAASEQEPDLEYRNYTMQQVYDAVTSDRAFRQNTEKYQLDVASAWNYMTELHNIKAINVRKETLEGILYRAEDEGKSKSHQHKLRSLMHKLCMFCVQHGIHQTDYSEGLRLTADVKGQRVPFADEDLRLLYKHRYERVPGIIWFLCMSGCRLVDIAKITRNDCIDFERHGIRLEGSKTAAGKNRYILLDPITWDVFMRFCDATKPGQRIFRSPNGSAWNIRNFRTREFYTGLEEIGVQDPHRYVPYSCRHTFASLAAKANVDKEALQRAIGHQIGSSVTDDYYISQDAHIAAAQEEFEKMANEIKCIIDAT